MSLIRLVRRGRSSGIGVTLISQRPQVLNKDVLTQAETLIGWDDTTTDTDAATGDDDVCPHCGR